MNGLQNHPGEHEFPVRMRARYVRPLAHARRERRSLADRWRVALIVVVAILLIAGGLWLLVPHGLAAIESRDIPPTLIASVVLVVIGAITVTVIPFLLAEAALPRREQKRYRRLGGIAPLTDAQQRLLALDALSDFTSGTWNSSLEYLPCEARLIGTGYDPRAFLSFTPISRTRAAEMLDELTGAATEWQLRRTLEDLMKGDASAQLRAVLGDPRHARRLQRLGELTGHPLTEIQALGTPGPQRAAPQLRGLDANRIVQAVRLGYMAGFLSETESWQLLARVQQAVHAHFGSLAEYVENMRIATAFMADTAEAVADFDRIRDGLLASNWPAARLLAPPDAATDVRGHRVRLPVAAEERRRGAG